MHLLHPGKLIRIFVLANSSGLLGRLGAHSLLTQILPPHMSPSKLALPGLFLSLAGSQFASGTVFLQNFQSYAAGANTFSDGSILRTNNSSVGVVYENSTSWKALRLTQDGDAIGAASSYFIPNLEPTHTISSFTTTFDLLIKNDKGVPADAFSFNVGTFKSTSGVYGNWDGMYDSSGTNTGPVLSIVWDTYDNGGDPNSIEVFLNGTSIGNNTSAGKTPYVAGNLDLAGFRSVTINWVNNQLNVSYNGQTIFSNLSTGSFTPALGDSFAFYAGTGGANQDVFVDNISITTVPEPSSLGLLGLAGVFAMRRRVRRA